MSTTRCSYVTSQDKHCQTKKLYKGTSLCKKHWKIPRARVLAGLDPLDGSDDEKDRSEKVEKVEKIERHTVKEKKRKIVVADSDENDEPVFTLKDIKCESKKDDKKEKREKKETKSKFIDELDDDGDEIGHGGAPQNVEDINAAFDDITGEVPEEGGEEGEEGEEERVPDLITNKIVKVGYFTLLQMAESLGNPYLDGLVKDCIGDKQIDECLNELALEYEETLGLGELDSHTKLLILTGVICSKKYMDNKVRASISNGNGNGGGNNSQQPFDNGLGTAAPSIIGRTVVIPQEFSNL